MGLIWALFSVGLACGAQLLLRSAMVELPPLTEIFTFLNHLLHLRAGTFGLAFGLMGYLCRWSAGTSPCINCRWRKPTRC